MGVRVPPTPHKSKCINFSNSIQLDTKNMKLCNIFNVDEQLKTFAEMKYGDPYYYLETEFMRFHKGIWDKDHAINSYKLKYEDKDNNKPYTMQYYNSTRTIFGTSKLAILLYIYFNYMKAKVK